MSGHADPFIEGLGSGTVAAGCRAMVTATGDKGGDVVMEGVSTTWNRRAA